MYQTKNLAKKHSRVGATVLLLAGAIALMAGCGGGKPAPTAESPGGSEPPAAVSPAPGSGVGQDANSDTGRGTSASTSAPAPAPSANTPPAAGDKGGKDESGATEVVAKPDDIAVLVNKKFALPADYKPKDLVEPNIPFIFKEKSEKRLLRKPAAEALEKLVAGAKKDGILLAGVSGYRSYETQKSLFNNYVKSDGEEAARKYSAEPGHSEHETGLAIDMSGSDGKCAATDCFGGTKEAKWLAEHAPEYGFIIRYPKGKESITGYQYEPWHIRYVGTQMAQEIAAKGLTLEEYLQNSVPVAK